MCVCVRVRAHGLCVARRDVLQQIWDHTSLQILHLLWKLRQFVDVERSSEHFQAEDEQKISVVGLAGCLCVCVCVHVCVCVCV